MSNKLFLDSTQEVISGNTVIVTFEDSSVYEITYSMGLTDDDCLQNDCKRTTCINCQCANYREVRID